MRPIPAAITARTRFRAAAQDKCQAAEPAEAWPPQYGGSGWSGASSGQDPSEVLGGPAAASVEIGRSQPTSGRSGGPAGVRRLGTVRRGVRPKTYKIQH